MYSGCRRPHLRHLFYEELVIIYFSVDDIKGMEINEGTIHQRRIKLFASPKSPVKRDEYGCGMAIIPVGHVHEEHAHAESQELIYVLQGTGTAIIGGKKIDIAPDHIVAIDKGEPHQFFNTGKEEMRLYWVYSPSGPEVRFLDK